MCSSASASCWSRSVGYPYSRHSQAFKCLPHLQNAFHGDLWRVVHAPTDWLRSGSCLPKSLYLSEQSCHLPVGVLSRVSTSSLRYYQQWGTGTGGLVMWAQENKQNPWEQLTVNWESTKTGGSHEKISISTEGIAILISMSDPGLWFPNPLMLTWGCFRAHGHGCAHLG